jgi:uncharacterized membrane protein
MEKSFKYVLYVILAVCVASVILTLTGNSSLKSMRKDIESAKKSAEDAQIELDRARHTIDALLADLDTMQTYVTYIQRSVTLNEARRIAAEATGKKEIEAAKKHVSDLTENFRTDSLPPIEEVPLKIKQE